MIENFWHKTIFLGWERKHDLSGKNCEIHEGHTHSFIYQHKLFIIYRHKLTYGWSTCPVYN